MTNLNNQTVSSCRNCVNRKELGFDFTMAFQPIVNAKTRQIFGYEALVRGLNNESAFSIISKVNDDNRYQFDQLCRKKAIRLAAKLGLKSLLSINFLPKSIYKPEVCIRATIEAAKEYHFPLNRIMFEFSETEHLNDPLFVRDIIEHYNYRGFLTAFDDFGSGYSGLNLLAQLQPNIVKLDMELIRNVDSNKRKQAIITNCLNLFKDLNLTPLAEGIETMNEMVWLQDAGIELMQGFLFNKPGFECLPEVDFDSLTDSLSITA